MPTFVTNAGRAVTGDTSGALFDHAFNVPVGVTYFVRPPLALVAEIIPPNGDLPDETNGDFGWAIGIKRAIGGHWFELLADQQPGHHGRPVHDQHLPGSRTRRERSQARLQHRAPVRPQAALIGNCSGQFPRCAATPGTTRRDLARLPDRLRRHRWQPRCTRGAMRCPECEAANEANATACENCGLLLIQPCTRSRCRSSRH